MTITTSSTTDVDVSKLSLKGVEQLTERCEHLIHSHKAALEDYELYIACRTELSKRNAPEPVFAGGSSLHFIDS